MQHAYRTAIVYYLLLALILIVSSLALFAVKIGIGYEAVFSYYRGDEHVFIPPKSVEGTMEVAWRHLGSMGLFIMVTAHFMLFAPRKYKYRIIKPSLLLFAAALVNIFSPLGIIEGYAFFVWLKMASVAALALGFAWLLGVLFTVTVKA